MKKHLLLFLVMISVGMFSGFGCSKDNGGSPTGGDVNAGSFSERSNVPNEPVTAGNADQVISEINTVAMNTYAKALTNVEKPAASITTNLGGDVAGLKNGKADIDGKVNTKSSGLTLTGVDYDVNCTYYDFSDDGELFLGGSIVYTGTVKYDVNFQPTDISVTMKGGLRFNGTYEGSEEFTVTIKTDITGTSTYEGTATITSAGKTFTQAISY